MLQYFKSIERVAASQGFEQLLPSTVRAGPVKSLSKEITTPSLRPTTHAQNRTPTCSLAPEVSLADGSTDGARSPEIKLDNMASRLKIKNYSL